MTKYLKLGFLSILSLAGLYIAFKGEDLDQLVFHLTNVNLTFVTIACALLIFSCIIRAYRWKLLLYPFDKVQLKKNQGPYGTRSKAIEISKCGIP